MAINWSAYEACKELYGNNIENIQDIGSRFPLFARACMQVNDEALLDILGALPKVTARVVESGLKELGSTEETEKEVEETEEVQEEKPVKKETKKTTKKAKKEEVEEDEDSDEETNEYESMSAKELYKLCCERGISSHCKSRSKDALIEVLEKHDNGELESAKKSKKAEKEEPKKKERKTKKEEPVEEDEDEWDEEEDSEETDPYAGKTAKELYKLCTDRGIKTKPKQNADVYVKLLKKADEAEVEEDDTEDEDDEWEI